MVKRCRCGLSRSNGEKGLELDFRGAGGHSIALPDLLTGRQKSSQGCSIIIDGWLRWGNYN